MLEKETGGAGSQEDVRARNLVEEEYKDKPPRAGLLKAQRCHLHPVPLGPGFFSHMPIKDSLASQLWTW